MDVLKRQRKGALGTNGLSQKTASSANNEKFKNNTLEDFKTVINWSYEHFVCLNMEKIHC